MLQGVRRGGAAGRVSRSFGRRDFLRGVGAAGAGIALAGSGQGVAVASTSVRLRPVYRLSTRGMVACNACKAQGAHQYFRKARFANHGRAHPGCDCRIVTQSITKQVWKLYFKNEDGSLRNVWDDRW